MDDLADLDFSFSCNKCTYTTKSIMEIKVHAMEHKKEENQTENNTASSKPEASAESVDESNEDDMGMVDIPVGRLDDVAPDVGQMMNKEIEETGNASSREQLTQVDSSTQSDHLIKDDEQPTLTANVHLKNNEQRTMAQSDHLKDDEQRTLVQSDDRVENSAQVNKSEDGITQVSISNDASNVAALSAAKIDDLLMIDMGTQMSPMPMDAPPKASRGRPRGQGAAKRKSNIPVREQVEEEPEEIEEETTEDEEMDVQDQDYEPPVSKSKRLFVNVNVTTSGRRGRRPLTRSKLKGLKKKKKAPPKPVAVVKSSYNCDSCDFTCDLKADLGIHLKEVHGVEIKIEELSDEGQAVDSDNDNLVEGMLPSRRKSVSDIPDDRYSCNVCKEFKCKFKKDLARHKHEAHNIIAPQYKYVSRVANDRYKCMQCGYKCKFQRQLRGHRRRAHPRPKPVIVPKTGGSKKVKVPLDRVPLDRYKCTECDFTCKFKGVLRAHRIKEHKKERNIKKAIKDLECEHCGKIIRGTQHHLTRHLKTHTGEKPWECDICGAVFAEKGRLNVHKPIHNEARPWLCEECGKSFKRAINLRMHRKIHVEVKPYQCELCAYRCTRHDTLNLHMKRKHLKLRRVLCTFCGKKFFSEKECQAHASRKHLPRPTPFQCTLCPAAFPFAYNLRAHMKKHPEHKPYKCEYCGFESRSKASLKDHERQHTALDGPNSDRDQYKPYKCGYCEFESRSKAYIKDHERQHTGEKEKKCDLCDYATTTSSNLYKHRKRQHGIIGMPAKQLKGRGRPPRANALLAAQVAAVASASRGSTSSIASSVPVPPVAHQHLPIHAIQPVTLTIAAAEDLVTQRPQQSEEERAADSIEDGTTEVTFPQQVAVQVQHIYNKKPSSVLYTQREKIIGSVITDALAEARNVVQSDIYASHMIPTTLPTTSISTSGLPSSSALQPVTVTHSGSTFTMAHAAALPHGTVVNIPEGMLTAGIPVTAQGLPVTAQGLHVPVTVAMQNVQAPGPATMFSSMMNMHY